MRRHSSIVLFASLLCVALSVPCAAFSTRQASEAAATTAGQWQTPARLRHLITKTSGTLTINDQGVEFRPNKGLPVRWSYVDIQSFRLTAGRLDIETYQNRGWHLSGDREFHFDLKNALPPAVAEEFAHNVQKPVENGRPNPSAPDIASIPARRRTFGGGTNGILRIRKDGVDYVTTGGRGSRSWRWSDIQTIANPDPYHFRLQGYRETFEFELKEPMSRGLFDQLWDAVYARGLNGLAYSEGRRP